MVHVIQLERALVCTKCAGAEDRSAIMNRMDEINVRLHIFLREMRFSEAR